MVVLVNHCLLEHQKKVCNNSILQQLLSLSFSLSLSLSVPSGYPQNLTATTLNATSILVTWSSVLPNETNGIIVNYTIFIDTDVSFVTAFTVDIKEATTLQYQFNGLQEFVNYSFSILASTAKGEGPTSPTVTNGTDEAGQ